MDSVGWAVVLLPASRYLYEAKLASARPRAAGAGVVTSNTDSAVLGS